MTAEYTDEFYRSLREGARKSARVIVPLVLDYIHPRSVVDVGCGTGTWLSVFRENGVTDILGVDGDHVKKEWLEIPDDRFLSFDLKTSFRIDRQFDLVISLEVAEHLPPECAGMFVDTLVGLGPVILFSAAIPLQGGTHHINEQWPDHWADLFKSRGYIPADVIRKRVWQNPDLDFWYAQNSLIFVQRASLKRYPALRNEIARAGEASLSLVHPRMHLEMGRRFTAANEGCAGYSSEADKFRSEAEANRAEAGRFKLEAEASRAEAELLAVESAKHRAKAETYRFKSDPRNMGLRKMLRYLPIVAVTALRRKTRRLFSRG
jgi:SAM-dependent methyltransferase